MTNFLISPAPTNQIKKQSSFLENSFDTLFGITLSVLMIIGILFSWPYMATFPLELSILFINGVLSIYGLLTSIHRKASIHFVSFLFCYLFLSLAPIVQIGANHDPVFYLDGILLKASLISFFFVIAGILLIQKIPVSVQEAETPKTQDQETDISEGRYMLLFCITLSLGVLCFALFRDGLFTSREGFGNVVGQIFSNQAIALVAIYLLKLSPFFGAAIGFRAAWINNNKKMIVLFGFLMIIAAIINNPMSSSRFFLAGLAFFFIDYVTRGQKVRLLAILIIIGIFTAPLFNTFRRDAPSTIIVERSLLEETLISMDYDAFQLANYTILTTEQIGVTWGKNLLGAVLFFAPRKFWQEKPPPTPHIVYDTMLQYRTVGTNNLSTPLMAEGFFAFSWFGAIGISILYWYGVTFLTRKARENPNTMAFLIRCVMVGLTLILLRGSLMVGMSAVIGFAFAAITPWLVFYMFPKDKKQKHASLL